MRVDLAALRRGHVEAGEECDIEGVGPIPVAEVRDLLDDPDTLVEAVLTDGVDVLAIRRLDRYISPALRTALETRDRACVVPGCGNAGRLEIDHITDFAKNGPTSLDNLARLCRHHHGLKTRKRWRLTRLRDGTWRFEPPNDAQATHRGGSPKREGGDPPGTLYIRWRLQKAKEAAERARAGASTHAGV